MQVIPGLARAVRRDKRYFITECEFEHPGALPRALLRVHRLVRPLPTQALRGLAPYVVFLAEWVEKKVDGEALCWNCEAGHQRRAESVEHCLRWLPEIAAILKAVSC